MVRAGLVAQSRPSDDLEREDLRQRRAEETREALAELDAGNLVDGDEVLAWIDTWGSDDELQPPR